VQCLEQDPGYSTGGRRLYLETNFIPGANISGCQRRPKEEPPRRATQGNSPHTFLNSAHALAFCFVKNEWMAWYGAAVQPFSR
jgi:hypothetical protein